jgi:hypothetical protein
MKKFAILLFFTVIHENLMSQFPYGTPNITEGNLECTYTQTYTERENDRVVTNTIIQVTFSTTLLINFAYTQEEMKTYSQMTGAWGLLSLMITANNFKRTFNENENVMSQVPRYNTSIVYSRDEWKIDPCNEGIDELIHCIHQEGKGFRTDPDRGVTFSLDGLKNDPTCFVAKVFADGGWSNQHDIILSCRDYRREGDRCQWITSKCNYSLTGPETCKIFLAGTDLPESFRGKNGSYTAVEDHSYENMITSYDYNFFRVDTSRFFEYYRKKPSSVQFVMPGDYRKVTKNTDSGNTSELNETATLVLGIGVPKKNRIILSTENMEDYHHWLPFRKGEQGYMPLKVKAKLISEDPEPRDTIHLMLDYVTHYPGFCTNYPIAPYPDQDTKNQVQDKKKKADLSADIRFAEVQSDPDVVYIDTFHIKTSKKVSEITFDIEAYDYGGSARLAAHAFGKDAEGYSVYNEQLSLILPEDENQNLIADRWEKDHLIFNKNAEPQSDTDEYPAGQKDTGDGYTLFEEYRGFFTDKDFSKGDKPVQRNGKFIRTNPGWKDIFIYDATGEVFEKWYAPSNAPDLNWHIVGDDQIRHESAVKIKNYLLNATDNSGEVSAAHKSYITNDLIRYDHRLINCNTPAKFIIDKHFGIFLFYSDRLDGKLTAGEVTADNSVYKNSLLKSTQFIEIQRYTPFEIYIINTLPLRARCSNETCNYNSIFKGEKECPLCKGKLVLTKYYDEIEAKEIVKKMYEGSVIHEIGHCLISIGHHTNGFARFTVDDGKIHKISGKELAAFKGDELQRAKNKLAELGVPECAMIYNFQNLEEFISGEMLNLKTKRYCQKNETYIDEYNNVRPSDNCYGKISVK